MAHGGSQLLPHTPESHQSLQGLTLYLGGWRLAYVGTVWVIVANRPQNLVAQNCSHLLGSQFCRSAVWLGSVSGSSTGLAWGQAWGRSHLVV